MKKLFLLVVIVMAAISASAQEGVYLGVASVCGEIMMWIKRRSPLRRM